MKNILTCFFIIISPVLKAQQVITGRITDATDGMPIERVEIFIANTTIGTLTNASGNYSITYQGTGSFEIVVSHVGYQPVFHKIDTPKSSHQYDVALEIQEIQEVTITASSNYSRSDVDLFWRTLLGVRPSRIGLQVLNPEKVFFYKNSDDVLKVSCKEPIEIVNHEMGYHIRYVLQSFELDYRTFKATFYGMPHFEELIPRNNSQKNRWEKKRQDVYAVSLTHFIRALYRDQTQEEGFLLIKQDTARHVIPAKDILQADQEMGQVNIESPLFLLCFGKSITDEMIHNILGIHIILGFPGSFPIMILLPQQFSIYPDGTYTGLLNVQEHRNSIIGLSARLPVEYLPNISHFD